MNYTYANDPEKWVAILTALALLAWGLWRRLANSTGGKLAPWQTLLLAIVTWAVAIGLPVCVWFLIDALVNSIAKGVGR